jgi:membrane-associated protease RseP (regulator of RpoE activity)
MIAYTVFVGLALASPGSALQTCTDSEVVVGTLGINRLSCNCSLTTGGDPSERIWEFKSEPLIQGVDADGPAAGKLRTGDVITTIDGYLITTAEGGRRYAQVQPGVPVELAVRRGGGAVAVDVTPGSTCRAQEYVSVPANPPLLRLLPIAGWPAHRITPKGWLGFGLSCINCVVKTGTTPLWTFSQPPVVNAVEPDSPAWKAGLRAGDRLLNIGGHPFITEQGARLFGAVMPGQPLALLYQRNGLTFPVDLVAGLRPVVSQPDSALADEQSDVTRFSGIVGDAFVQVTGSPVTVSHTDDEVVIRSNDITVRIRRTGGGSR